MHVIIASGQPSKVFHLTMAVTMACMHVPTSSVVFCLPQIGMFAFSGMTPEMVDKLASQYSIYMTRNGRISMAGVNTKNIDRLATAMNEVIKAK